MSKTGFGFDFPLHLGKERDRFANLRGAKRKELFLDGSFTSSVESSLLVNVDAELDILPQVEVALLSLIRDATSLARRICDQRRCSILGFFGKKPVPCSVTKGAKQIN